MGTNRCSSFFSGMITGYPLATEAESISVARTSQPNRPMMFRQALHAACAKAGDGRDDFVAKAVAELRVGADTADRWYDGKNVPNTEYRPWFQKTYGLDVKLATEGAAETLPAPVDEPAPGDSRDAYLSFALGSLQTAVSASDDQIVHDVRDSLNDDQQRPWMKIAVTLIRQAFQRG